VSAELAVVTRAADELGAHRHALRLEQRKTESRELEKAREEEIGAAAGMAVPNGGRAGLPLP